MFKWFHEPNVWVEKHSCSKLLLFDNVGDIEDKIKGLNLIENLL